MRANLFRLIVLCIGIITGSALYARSQTPQISEKSFRQFATLTKSEIVKDKILVDATLGEIDEVLAANFGEIYSSNCKSILSGPKTFAVFKPQRIGNVTVVGYTEEYESIHHNANGDVMMSDRTRYVYYWRNDYFKKIILESMEFGPEEFSKLVAFNKIDLNGAVLFSFPRLAKLVAVSGGQTPSLAGAPPMPEDVRIESGQELHKAQAGLQNRLSYRADAADDNENRFGRGARWIMFGSAILAAILAVRIIRARCGKKKM